MKQLTREQLIPGTPLKGYVRPLFTTIHHNRYYSIPEVDGITKDGKKVRVRHVFHSCFNHEPIGYSIGQKIVFVPIEEILSALVPETEYTIKGNKYSYVLSKLEDEGFHYALTSYSNWDEVEDPYFLDLVDQYKTLTESITDFLERNEQKLAEKLTEAGDPNDEWSVEKKQ